METICKCPKCGNDVTENTFSYNCGCGFKVSKEMWGVKISPETAKKICQGEATDFFTFQKDDRTWEAQLEYDRENDKLVYKYKGSNTKKIICDCPKCGKHIVDTGKYYLCEEHKKACNLIIFHEVCGAKITEEDVKQLVAGETIRKEFTWKSGKTGEAGLKLKEDKTGTELVF